MNKLYKAIAMAVFAAYMCCLGVPVVGADMREENALFKEAVGEAQGNQHFAFMKFNQLVTTAENREILSASLFAVGEYYYNEHMYKKAQQTFQRYVNEFPDHEGAVFGYAYLLKLLTAYAPESDANVSEKERITKDIYAKPIVFLFSESRKREFTSPLSVIYEADYYVDKVLITRNTETFIEIEL